MAPLRSATFDTTVSLTDLKRLTDGWLLDGQYRQLSPRTLEARRTLVEKLLWFLHQQKCTTCGTLELKQYITYVASGHTDKNGRWGNAQCKQAVRPRTVRDYYSGLKTFFHWVVSEGYMDASPVDSIRPPIFRPDQI